VTHGHRKGGKSSPTYTSWRTMRRRCSDPDHPAYPNYGGKGIEVCERWSSFENFLEDMGERPSKRHTLGRATPFSDYAPGEVEWETLEQQNAGLHDKSGEAVEVDGVTRTKQEWANHLGLSYRSLCRRLQRGWGLDAYRIPAGVRRPT